MSRHPGRFVERVIVVVLAFAGSLTAGSPYGGGTGEPDDPYLIYTAEQLNAIGVHPADSHSHFKLMADIDLSEYTGTEFHIIGPDYRHRITGVFDGNGHSISNFTYDAPDRDYTAFFGYVDDFYAEIKNLVLINPRVTADGGSNVGCLVGYIGNGMTVRNCCIQGGLVSGGGSVGGLVGKNLNGLVVHCCSSAEVRGNGGVGGLIGSNDGLLSYGYATGAVSGGDHVGGLVGSNSGDIAECYSTGAVVGNFLYAGGLVGGGSSGGQVTASFWDSESSGQAASYGGHRRTSAQMHDPQTFTAAGWDFFGSSDGPSDVWAIDPRTGYLILWWQVPQNELPKLPSFAGGSGTSEDPYRIATARQLNSIAHNPRLMASHFELVSDIDLRSVEFRAIGSELLPFTGDFDGDHRTISNLSHRYDEASFVGLFGHIAGESAIVRNLTLIDPDIAIGSGNRIGALAGKLTDGRLRNCHVQGANVSGTTAVGGLVGANEGTIQDCSADATVTGKSAVGGVAGTSRKGSIRNCRATGAVTGGTYDTGGVTGYSTKTIANCSANCTVKGDEHVGGIVGYVGDGVLINCYVDGGSTSGDSRVGGLVGRLNTGNIRNCYSSCTVSGRTEVGGLVGSRMIGYAMSSFWNVEVSGQGTSAVGMGKTSAEMRDPDTFNGANWDFFGPGDGPSDIWVFDPESRRPMLWWQVPQDRWPPLPNFAGGTGTVEDPYRIDSAKQLCSIGHNPRLMECSFTLVCHVDLAGAAYFPIGDVAAPFAARFDGNNCAVSDLTCVREASHVGFLGCVEGPDAQVEDLTLIESHVQGGNWPFDDSVGSLVGSLEGGALLNCSVEGGSVSGGWYTGGLAGLASGAVIRDCHATNSVAGGLSSGGLVGECSRSTITRCHATGTVTAEEGDTGGLVGQTSSATIRDCFATGDVIGDGSTGGLAGWASGSTITGSYAAGSVSGSRLIGGLLGHNSHIVTHSYATGNVSGKESVGGLIGSNLGAVEDCNSTGAVTGDSAVGGLIGDHSMGPIDHSHAGGAVTGKQDVGGLLGKSDSSDAVTNCSAAGAVSGQTNVGGLAGYSESGKRVSSCRATGAILGQTNVGGLVGNHLGHSISDSYATGSVSGQENVGGLVGRNGERIDPGDLPPGAPPYLPTEFPGFIEDCYSTGHVSGVTKAGGLVGLHRWGSVTASFWDKQTSGQIASDGGRPKGTVEMQAADTFVDAGWDFGGETRNGTEDIWWILEGQDYPRLRWEQDPYRP